MATIFGDVLYIPKSWDIYQPLIYLIVAIIDIYRPYT